MAANTGEIKLTLTVDDKGSVQVKNFAGGAGKSIKKFTGSASMKFKGLARIIRRSLGGALGFISKQMFSLKGLIVGLGMGLLAKQAVEVASGFQKMQLSLDTITKGKGEEWFKKLNEWALKMPVNTEKAIQSFIMMRAMGLKPTLDQMTVLVDTMSALGGGGDTLEGIARALGQIATKGKVSAEELMQLAERGVPVFEILKEKFGDVETSSLDAGEAIKAIFAGLAGRFGGQSEKMQNIWAGMTETLKSYWKEFQRLVMESGVMEWLENKLKLIIVWVDKMRAEGKFQKYAEEVGGKIVEWAQKAEDSIKRMITEFQKVLPNIKAGLETIYLALKKIMDAMKYIGKNIGETLGSLVVESEKLGAGRTFRERMTAAENLQVPAGKQVSLFGTVGNQLGVVGGPSPEEADKAATARIESRLNEEYQKLESGNAGGTTVNQYFNQQISRSDVANITTEAARQVARE